MFAKGSATDPKIQYLNYLAVCEVEEVTEPMTFHEWENVEDESVAEIKTKEDKLNASDYENVPIKGAKASVAVWDDPVNSALDQIGESALKQQLRTLQTQGIRDFITINLSKYDISVESCSLGFYVVTGEGRALTGIHSAQEEAVLSLLKSMRFVELVNAKTKGMKLSWMTSPVTGLEEIQDVQPNSSTNLSMTKTNRFSSSTKFKESTVDLSTIPNNIGLPPTMEMRAKNFSQVGNGLSVDFNSNPYEGVTDQNSAQREAEITGNGLDTEEEQLPQQILDNRSLFDYIGEDAKAVRKFHAGTAGNFPEVSGTYVGLQNWGKGKKEHILQTIVNGKKLLQAVKPETLQFFTTDEEKNKELNGD